MDRMTPEEISRIIAEAGMRPIVSNRISVPDKLMIVDMWARGMSNKDIIAAVDARNGSNILHTRRKWFPKYYAEIDSGYPGGPHWEAVMQIGGRYAMRNMILDTQRELREYNGKPEWLLEMEDPDALERKHELIAELDSLKQRYEEACAEPTAQEMRAQLEPQT